MAALTANKNRQNKVHQRQLNIAPANAGDVFYVGAILVREAAAGLCTPGADAAGVIPLGVVVESMFPDDPDTLTAHLDNTSGADGVITGNPESYERVVRYDQVGEYAFTVSGATPKVGDPAYIVDDDTVSAASTTNDIQIGTFTRPAPSGGWFVDISRRA